MSATCVVVGSVTEPGGCVTPPTNPVSSLVPTHLVPHVTHVASSLPFTGSDIKELAIIGISALAAGALLRWKRRVA